MCFYSKEVDGSVPLESFQGKDPNAPFTVGKVTSHMGQTIMALLGVSVLGNCVVCVESGTPFLMTLPNATAEKMGLLPTPETDPVTYEVILVEREDDEWHKPDKVLVPTIENCYIELDFDERFLDAKFHYVEEWADVLLDFPETIAEKDWEPAFMPAIPLGSPVPRR